MWIQIFPSPKLVAKVKEPSLPYYLPFVGGKRMGFIPFPRVILCEIQSASFRVIKSCCHVSYDDNDYTRDTSNLWLER